MASFSDDETFEVDSVLQQRKRKGVLEYLVRWKSVGESPADETWEPAKNIVADCALAVQKFLDSQKTKKKRSTSRSRKVSRSRSRSSSRSRKAAASKGGKTKSQSRSRSRGRPTKAEAAAKAEEKAKQEEEEEKATPSRSSRSRGTVVITESNSAVNIKAATETTQEKKQTEAKAAPVESAARTLRSSTMKTREQLEVQRVHNDQRPTREDDSKPRSAIWKVADYAVIALFIISALAAFVLFLEKFVDLEEFKKQAYPNFGVLKTRLEGAQKSLVDLAYSGVDKVSDLWLYLMENIKGAEKVKVQETAAPGA